MASRSGLGHWKMQILTIAKRMQNESFRGLDPGPFIRSQGYPSEGQVWPNITFRLYGSPMEHTRRQKWSEAGGRRPNPVQLQMKTTPLGASWTPSGTLENLNFRWKYKKNQEFEPPDPKKRKCLQMLRFFCRARPTTDRKTSKIGLKPIQIWL